MTRSGAPDVLGYLPRLAKLLGRQGLDAQAESLSRLAASALWQVEHDLELLERYLSWSEIERAYGNVLRNPGQFVPGMYEVRVASLLAPFVEKLELVAESKAGKRCDLKFKLEGKEVFVEVSTREDQFPPEYGADAGDVRFYSRATVEKSFTAATGADDSIAASEELRQRIMEKAQQLPAGEMAVVVVGVRGGHSLDVECALFGDEMVGLKRNGRVDGRRVANGLFTVGDDIGGASQLSAVVWMKLARHWADVRVYSRVFVNEQAMRPLADSVGRLLVRVFDRKATLLEEATRIGDVYSIGRSASLCSDRWRER